MLYLTGFEAFAHYDENPTKTLLSKLSYPDTRVLILPVEFGGAFELMKQTKPSKSKTIVHFGVSDRAPRWQFEYYAHNLRHSSQEQIIAKSILDGGPEVIKTSAPILRWLGQMNDFQSGAVELSTSAGSYVCNDLYYLSLNEYSKDCEVLFVHVPDFGLYESHNYENQRMLLDQFIRIISVSKR